MKESKAMRNLKFEINYTTLLATIENFPDLLEESRGVFEEVVGEMRGVLEKLEDEGEGGVLVHGDFWSGKYELLFLFCLSFLPFTSVFVCEKRRIWLTKNTVSSSQTLLSHPSRNPSISVSSTGSSHISLSTLSISVK